MREREEEVREEEKAGGKGEGGGALGVLGKFI